VKERPILFGAPMVRAILAGQKTQTRRVVKAPPHLHAERCQHFEGATWDWLRYDGLRLASFNCPYGKPGDRLWVRETWKEAHPMAFQADRKGLRLLHAGIPGPPPVHYLVAYRADGELLPIWSNTGGHPYRQLTPKDDVDRKLYPKGRETGWLSPIYMPRRASRITLEITEIRIERLQDISEEDAEAEGIEGIDHPTGGGDYQDCWRDYTADGDADGWPWFEGDRIASYKSLWQSINGQGSWDANPWVWVVEFRRLGEG